MVMTCLAYLEHSKLLSDEDITADNIVKLEDGYLSTDRFLTYAITQWPAHTRLCKKRFIDIKTQFPNMFHYKSTLRKKWAYCYDYLFNGHIDIHQSAEPGAGRFGLIEWASHIIIDKQSRREDCSELFNVMAWKSIGYGHKDFLAFLLDPSICGHLLSSSQSLLLVRDGLINALGFNQPDIAKLLISIDKDFFLYQKPISKEIIQLMDQPEYEDVKALSELLINDHIKNSQSNQSEGSWLWLLLAARENYYSALQDLLDWGVLPEAPRCFHEAHLFDHYHIGLHPFSRIQDEKSMIILLIHGRATRTQHRKSLSKRLLRGNGPNFDMVIRKALRIYLPADYVMFS